MGTPGYDRARTLLAALPVKGWDRHTDFSRYRFGDPGPTTSTSSSVTTAEHPRRHPAPGPQGTGRAARHLLRRRPACYSTRTPVRRFPSYAGPTSDAVQIDHVVSLSDAWYEGAREWDEQRRRDFANEPRNLLAVGGKANFDKAFRDAAAWLPPADAFHCEFVARQVEVKAAYRLSVSANEKRAMEEVLDDC